MAYESLRDLVNRLDAAGELTRFSTPVDPTLEITEIADREMKKTGGGKALLHVPFLLGSHTRIPLPLAEP